MKINGKWYFFKADGVMADREVVAYTDADGISHRYCAGKNGALLVDQWYYNETSSYYFDEDGEGVNGVVVLNGNPYYFRNGLMIRNTNIVADQKYYVINEKGIVTEAKNNAWTKADGKYYYVKDGKFLFSTIEKIGTEFYGFDYKGRMYDDEAFQFGRYYRAKKGGQLYRGEWYGNYYYNSTNGAVTGELLTGDQKIDGKWYHFDEGGGMETGVVKTETGVYIYGEDGVYVGKVKKGWNRVSGNWYYFDGESFASEKLMTIGKYTYYFDWNGKMAADGIAWVSTFDPDTGRRVKNEAKLFDTEGHLVKAGWYGLYYVDPATGNAVTGSLVTAAEKVINGKTYRFNKDGICITKDYLEIKDPSVIWSNASGEIIEKSPQLIQVASTGEVISRQAMPDGWKLFHGTWYYYKNGLAVNGWVGKYYVKAGAMLRNSSTPDGYWVGQDGAYQKNAGWVRVNKERENGMYVKAGGRLAENEWLNLEGKWYYFHNYSRVTGAQRINGTWYLFGEDGTMQSTLGKLLKDGWKKAGSEWYYFRGGALVNGSLSIGGKEYTFRDSRMIGGPGFENVWHGYYGSKEDGCYYNNENGEALKFVGWKQIDEKWYRFGENSKAYMNYWYRVNGKLYYQREDGIVTGVQLIEGRLYQFDKNGALIKLCTYDDGWHKLEGKWYFFRGGRPVTSNVVTSGGRSTFSGQTERWPVMNLPAIR